MGAMEDDSRAVVYIGWEEAVVSNEKGRREIRYYLKRRGGGGRDLVVVGKEKSSRHTSYRYAVEGKKLLVSFYNRSSWLKLRSRREVIDWLKSFVSGEPHMDYTGKKIDGAAVKVRLNHNSQIGVCKNDFTWLGSPWTCRKRRHHYQSFCRNGAVISANDFIYVLAEEGKRLVAYLDDMYEDSHGSKMVVVRWFHKLDEVGFILPHSYNDREIFFSLCLQDLSIECIDGLATVLSPEHYEKFFDEATSMGLMPFVCSRLFENDDVKLFDITRVKGYWNQGILKKIFPPVEHPDGIRPSKRIRWSIDCDLNVKSPNQKENMETAIPKEGGCPRESSLKKDESTIVKCRQFLTIGSDIEILSQDSGIRGCWFRASVIKKHKDKVKVQYRDLKDALDDMKPLEEWILATRIVSLDALGIRLSGRMVARPMPGNDLNQVSGALNVGCVVDAWWNDGWWEGIVTGAKPGERVKVYFPGEKQELIFSIRDLRHSREWLDNQWHNFDERPGIVSSIYSTTNTTNPLKDGSGIINRTPDAVDINKKPRNLIKIVHKKRQTPTEAIRDLLKDSLLSHLRWKTSGKRRRRSSRSPIHKIQFGNSETHLQSLGKYLMNSFDPDNCKYASDTHYSSSVVPPVTNLVMSR